MLNLRRQHRALFIFAGLGLMTQGISAATVQDAAWQTQARALSQKLFDQVDGQSFVLSPASLVAVLALLRDGASGKTRSQIERVSGNPALGSSPSSRERGLEAANAVFVRSPLKVSPAYQHLVTTDHDAMVKDVPGAGGGRWIDDWIAKRTHGKIQDLLGTNDLTAELIAVNALYFHGRWALPFDRSRTGKGVFYGKAGQRRIPFMHVDGRFAHYADDRIQAVALPYKDNNFVFEILLPANGRRMPVRKLLTIDPWPQLSAGEPVQGSVALPKLDISSRFKLDRVLQAAGITDAFDSAKADFSVMTVQKQRLFLGQVVQKVRLEIDEQGTTAAAATAADLIGGLSFSAPFDFKADRPFVFALRHRSTGALVFLGYYDASR